MPKKVINLNTDISPVKRLKSILANMKSRCYNDKIPDFVNYGKRGITVCEEWLDCFEIFQEWALANGYSNDLTIDRIDNNGNYEPSNCRWVTKRDQVRNRSNNVWYEINGEVILQTDAFSKYGRRKFVLHNRINK